ncbi:MAG TPA: NAD(P)/FAD-dependent oxidoreductase, partial [Planctomycetes bacterium]|nr:NAD(P)/FAD-dependent oxidoreductase [Planctomycetota bacterium]
MAAERTDLLVVGGGIEALAAATTVARAGRSVRLISRKASLGEIDASWEFHRGYRTAGLRCLSAPRPAVVAKLRLEEFGYRSRPAPGSEEARPLTDPLLDEMAGIIATIQEFADAPPRELIDPSFLEMLRHGATLRRTRRAMGITAFADALRVVPMRIEDWLSERFDDPRLRAHLAAPALFGGWVGPLSPSTAFLWLLAHAGGTEEPAGGGPALVSALEGAARAAGVTIDTSTPVGGWIIEEGRVVGAMTDGGEQRGEQVLSTDHPRITILERLGAREVPATVREDLGATRSRGLVAVMHVALDTIVEGAEERWVGDSPLDWERAFDAAKHGTIPERPCLRLRVASADDPSIAPAGGSVLKLQVFAVPVVSPEEADQQRQALEARVFEQLDTIDEGWRSAIVGHQLITPTDLEQHHHLPGGNLEQVDLALDQVFSLRPCASLGKYRTPVEGLFIAGAGTHPGGPFPCSSGVL